MKLFEKGPGFASGLKDFWKYLNASTIGAGLISTIFGCSGPCLIVIAGAKTAGFTLADTVTWVFGIYIFGGLLGAILATYYKIPVSGAYSIPGATLMGAALKGYTFNEAAGAFVLAGVIVLIIGLTGVIGKIMKVLPVQIVMAMVAGCMMKFGIGIVTNTSKNILVCGLALTAFFLVPKVIKKMPGVLAALIVGVGACWFTGSLKFTAEALTFIPPRIITPVFNASLVLSCALPLAILVIGAENAQAMGVLQAQNYPVPANAMTVSSGIGGIISGLFGAHNANIAGPMTAICASEVAGPKEGRYVASVVNGLTFAAFGLFASFAIGFVNLIPGALIGLLAGLAMINVLVGAMKVAFETGTFKLGAFAAFVVGMSGLAILHVGSAFWALVIGFIVSIICEPADFRSSQKE